MTEFKRLDDNSLFGETIPKLWDMPNEEASAVMRQWTGFEPNMPDVVVVRCELDCQRELFALLAVLARRQGEILSKTVIAELVWDMNFDSNTNVVEVAIKRLRAKIDAPFGHSLLHTIRGMGYVLEDRDGRESE